MPILSEKPKKLRRIVIASFVAIPLLCCGGTALFARRWIDVFDYSADLDRLVAEAKKQGLPFVASDLRVAHKSPEGNAKPAIEKAMRESKLSAAARKLLTDYRPVAGAQFPAELANFAKAGRQIAQFEYFDSEKDRDLGVYIRYPEYSLLKDASKALALEAEQFAFDGKIDEAIANLSAIRNFGAQIRQDKHMIGGMVYLALNQIFIRGCLRTGEALKGHPGKIKRIRNFLAQELPSCSFRDCFAGEYYNGITLARNYDELGGVRGLSSEEPITIDSDRLIREGLPKGVVQRGMLAAYIRHSLEILKYFDSEKNLHLASKKADEYMAKQEMTVSNSLPLILLPVLNQTGTAWEKQPLTQKIAVVSLDILASANKPASIPPIEDTIGGGQVLYRTTEKGFLVYSKGKNGKDNGGPKNKTDRRNSDDIGFEFPLLS